MRAGRFLDQSLAGFLAVIERALESEALARRDGLLQRLDPRVKVCGLAAMIVAAASARRLPVIGALFAAAVVLALWSAIPLRTLALRIWGGVLLFAGLIALPALFLTPGRAVWSVPVLGWALTEQGLRGAAFLISRVETTATLSVLLVLSTPWLHVLKALRVLRVPAVIVVILGMTYRYLFVLIGAARELLESRRSRTVGRLAGRDRRRLAVSALGVLLSRTLLLSSEVYLAMQSRGFRGEVYILDEFAMSARDWLALGAFLALSGAALWIGGWA